MVNQFINFLSVIFKGKNWTEQLPQGSFKSSRYHWYNIVNPSPWPLLIGLNSFPVVIGMVGTMQGIISGLELFISSFFTFLFFFSMWNRDIIRESTYIGLHTKQVDKNTITGFKLFLFTETMLFISFFWAHLYSALYPSVFIGLSWPPIGLVDSILDPFDIPLVNTVILVYSGFTVTLSHLFLRRGNKILSCYAMLFTIILGLSFLYIQKDEFLYSAFDISDGIYGSTFFMLTGFHGGHVIIGVLSLIIVLYRTLELHFSSYSHTGFKLALLYWHFVDIVWIFLYLIIYVLASDLTYPHTWMWFNKISDKDFESSNIINKLLSDGNYEPYFLEAAKYELVNKNKKKCCNQIELFWDTYCMQHNFIFNIERVTYGKYKTYRELIGDDELFQKYYDCVNNIENKKKVRKVLSKFPRTFEGKLAFYNEHFTEGSLSTLGDLIAGIGKTERLYKAWDSKPFSEIVFSMRDYNTRSTFSTAAYTGKRYPLLAGGIRHISIFKWSETGFKQSLMNKVMDYISIPTIQRYKTDFEYVHPYIFYSTQFGKFCSECIDVPYKVNTMNDPTFIVINNEQYKQYKDFIIDEQNTISPDFLKDWEIRIKRESYSYFFSPRLKEIQKLDPNILKFILCEVQARELGFFDSRPAIPNILKEQIDCAYFYFKDWFKKLERVKGPKLWGWV